MDHDTKSTRDTDAVEESVRLFLARNFPQIAMHGGDAAIEGLDLETGEVWLQLGGACSGCGISPITIQAIQSRLPQEVPEITTVHVDTGMPIPMASTDSDFSDVPF